MDKENSVLGVVVVIWRTREKSAESQNNSKIIQ